MEREKIEKVIELNKQLECAKKKLKFSEEAEDKGCSVRLEAQYCGKIQLQPTEDVFFYKFLSTYFAHEVKEIESELGKL